MVKKKKYLMHLRGYLCEAIFDQKEMSCPINDLHSLLKSILNKIEMEV